MSLNTTSPTLEIYLLRIGAERLSFKRAMVKEYGKGASNHYYVEKTLIEIEPDGTIVCRREEHQPTEAEQDEIKREFSKIEFPKSIGASLAGYKKFVSSSGRDPDMFFPMWDRNDDSIRMVQERVNQEDGGKYFVPWSMWSDGEWRNMEPDGNLPFWKPRENSGRSRIMIHEGCKAASRVSAMVDDPASVHPWKDFLSDYEHWGMVGGALAPHRTEYQEIRREKPEEVVYVCDNDYAGESALQMVSKCYGGSLKGIRFGKQFPASWDMADPMPPSLFSVVGRYTGPALTQLMTPATRATEIKAPDGKKGRPTTVLRRAFAEEWVHSVRPEVFIHKEWPSKIHTLAEFNNLIAPYSDVDDTARLLKKDDASKTAFLKYDPGRPPGVYGDGGRYLNTHTPSIIRAEKGDPAPWLDFMDRLIPAEKDRTELLRWVATLVARPEIKMTYGVLLISETQGIGKGTLGEKILAPLVGEHNTSFPSENDVVESNYNYWLAHKRLAVVHEIYAGHSAKAYNKLKSVITDNTMTVSMKYQANYEMDNWIHVFACSNSMRAIQLSYDDRRWAVPKVTELKNSKEYWTNFNSWLTEAGGLGIIRWWASEWVKTNDPVMRGAAAPWSTTKREVIEEGYSPGMILVENFLDKVEFSVAEEGWVEKHTKPEGANGEWVSPGVAIVDASLVDMIRFHIYDGKRSDRLEKPLTVRKVAKAKNWFVHPQQKYLDGAKHGKIICSEKAMTEMPIAQLLTVTRPLQVKELAREWFSY